MSLLYSVKDPNEVVSFNYDTFIFATGNDERTLSMLNILSEKENKVSNVLLLKYSDFDLEKVALSFPGAKVTSISITDDASHFISQLQNYESVFRVDNILVDITSVRIPEMFMLLKHMKLLSVSTNLEISYATPVEYEFEGEPFTSYHSYYGNLKTTDIVGFGGMSEDMSHSQMIIFLGFEGVLSAKVNEDIRYERLILVNNLPSFYEKYKDISMINNYDLLTSRHERLAYVPANNPFETFNFLNELLSENESVCIAPLSTKPVALGVCLYALAHDNVRVVYPIAEEYNHHRANSVHTTYLYKVPFDVLD